ncbi:MAG: nucleotide exchange factor GrpE [Treponema sp.]|jgi:molecular chaperone GrpE (heat shock protein)|nr:nucleotide exchange factor GrpE [Treponema sp.]
MIEPQKTDADNLKEIGNGSELNTDAQPVSKDEGGTDIPLPEQPVAPAASAQPTESKDPIASQDKSPTSSSDDSQEGLKSIQTGIKHLEQELGTIAESSKKTAGELREMHKLYHNEFANRVKSMQDELDRYREMEKGRAFDGILGEVAKLYADYEPVLDRIEDAKIKEGISYMFQDITQILEAYGVGKQKSNLGDKRNTKYCQIEKRIPTGNPDLHDTIAESHSTGFYIGNRPLVKEYVDIYLYTEKSADKSAEN